MDTVLWEKQMNTKTATIFINDEVMCQVTGLEDRHTKMLYDQFGLFVDGYAFNHAFKLGRWDGKKRFFHRDCTTYIRLLDEVVPAITRLGYKLKLVDNRETKVFDIQPITSSSYQHVKNPKNGEPWEVRPYQVDAINKAIEHGNGIILAGCVHPDTMVQARLIDQRGAINDLPIRISAVKELIEDRVAVYVNSPDGYVYVTNYVDKGVWPEYQLSMCDGTVVRSNGSHLYEVVDRGWVTAEQLAKENQKSLFVTFRGTCYGRIATTGRMIPIVDITVDHANHRYYTNGVSSHNTGAGKSSITAILTDLYGQAGARVLTIVPNKSLVRQSFETFAIFGIDAGILYGDEKDLNHTHLVTTWQSLNNQMELVHDFDVVLIDECQGVKSKVLTEILNIAGGHIGYRIGLTGSLPKHEADAKSIKSALGEVLYTVEAHELIADGFLSTANIQLIVTRDQKHIDIPKDGPKLEYAMEMDLLRRNKARNQWICNLIVEQAGKPKGNCLVLVGDVKYGKALQKAIPDSIFLHGNDKQKIREQFYKAFETENNMVVIATVQIAGVGLSIDRIFNLFFIDIGKSYVRVIQAVGRGLRVGRDKNHVDVFDITSDLPTSASHTRKRKTYYKEANYPVQSSYASYEQFIDVSDVL